MRFKMIVLSLAVLGFFGSARAQSTTPTEWLIVTTSESHPNASPVSAELNGTTINCSGTNPDNQNAQDVGKLGPVGDCYNPLTLTFDANLPVTNRGGNFCKSSDRWSTDATSLDAYGYTDVSRMTNSIGSFNDPQPAPAVTSIIIACKEGKYTIVMTDYDNSVFIFTASAGSDPMSGTFDSFGGTSQNDKGDIVIYSNIVLPSGSYTGSFDSNFASNGTTQLTTSSNATLNFGTPTITSDFTYSNEITLTQTSGDVCFFANSNVLTSTDPAAEALGPNFVTGDLSVINFGDGEGTVVSLYITPGNGPNGVFGDGANPDSSASEFVTYTVSASPVPGCAYTTGYDSPFHRKQLGRISVYPKHWPGQPSTIGRR